MKKICFLSSRHDPKDKRIFEKQAKDAYSWGYDVIHLATGDENHEFIEDGVRVIVFRHARSIFGRLTGITKLYRKANEISNVLKTKNNLKDAIEVYNKDAKEGFKNDGEANKAKRQLEIKNNLVDINLQKIERIKEDDFTVPVLVHIVPGTVIII